MKTICGISKVKDNADVIESFCRYHLSFFDQLLIWDDASTDATPEIVQKLIEEGLPIELILTNKNQIFLQNSNTISYGTQYIAMFEKYGADWAKPLAMLHARSMAAINKYNADWIICLDVDEFIYCEDGKNPRIELDKLEDDVEYRLYWRTSIYSKEPSDSAVFLPNYFKEYRDPALERFPKAILSKELAEKRGGAFGHGMHNLIFPDEDIRTSVQILEHPILRIAHFPIRSIAQALVKVICMRLRFSMFEGDKPFQYEPIYNQIKSEGIPNQEQVRQFSLEYALSPEQLGQPVSTVKQFRGALRADFLQNDIKLAYTNYRNYNYLEPVLTFFELLLDRLKAGNDASEQERNERQKQLEEAQCYIRQLEDNMLQSNEGLTQAQEKVLQLETDLTQSNERLVQLQEQVQQLQSSTSWRITKPMRVVMDMLRGR